MVSEIFILFLNLSRTMALYVKNFIISETHERNVHVVSLQVALQLVDHLVVVLVLLVVLESSPKLVMTTMMTIWFHE